MSDDQSATNLQQSTGESTDGLLSSDMQSTSTNSALEQPSGNLRLEMAGQPAEYVDRPYSPGYDYFFVGLLLTGVLVVIILFNFVKRGKIDTNEESEWVDSGAVERPKKIKKKRKANKKRSAPNQRLKKYQQHK